MTLMAEVAKNDDFWFSTDLAICDQRDQRLGAAEIDGEHWLTRLSGG